MSALEIGDRSFRTKAEAIKYTRAILHDSPLGDLPEEHAQFVVALLRRHPRSEQKIGAGIGWIEIRENPPFRARSFWIVRIDRTETDFSYKGCLCPSSSRVSIMSAFRGEVQYQCLAFRDQEFIGKLALQCPITGKDFERDECEVDHHPEAFRDLVERFCDGAGLRLEEVRVHEGDGDTFGHLFDRGLARCWQEFHREHATFRVLSAEGHRIETSRKRSAA